MHIATRSYTTVLLAEFWVQGVAVISIEVRIILLQAFLHKISNRAVNHMNATNFSYSHAPINSCINNKQFCRNYYILLS